MNQDRKNLMAVFADKNYINQIKQVFSSAYWNGGWKGDYMLLTPDMPEKELKWFRDKGILIKKVRSPVKYKGLKGFPLTLYTIFYLFTPEFKKWKTVIYLDVDVIIRASLDNLTEIKGFAAASDILDSKLAHQFPECGLAHTNHSLSHRKKLSDKEHQETIRELKKKYNLRKPLFNAGVFAFNTNIIKKDTFSKLIMLFEKYGKISFCPPQGELNLLFYNKWEKLPQVYNAYPYFFSKMYKINKIDGIILHFSAANPWGKPWNPKNPFYDEWKINLQRANKIDLDKPQKPSTVWTRREINKHLLYLKTKSIPFIIDKNIGLIGIFLKNKLP